MAPRGPVRKSTSVAAAAHHIAAPRNLICALARTTPSHNTPRVMRESPTLHQKTWLRRTAAKATVVPEKAQSMLLSASISPSSRANSSRHALSMFVAQKGCFVTASRNLSANRRDTSSPYSPCPSSTKMACVSVRSSFNTRRASWFLLARS